jgi:hypothetical protein
MRRLVSVALLTAAVWGQSGMRDRYFVRYPFDRWLTEGDKSEIRWIARVQPPRLTAHQRFSARVEIEIDARDIEKRRGQGELITFVQMEDSAGRLWRAHNTFDLTRIPKDAKASAILYSQEAFLVPGDYKVALAACDSRTGEHSFTRRTLHVGELRHDTLPQSGKDLPAVEFVRPLDAPDNWFQPYIRGRLSVALETRRPVHVDLVMNMTPSERANGPLRSFRRNMSVLIPALKLLAGMEVKKGTLDVALLDLTRQKVWEQKAARGLDWMKMRAPLADLQPGVIDAQSLAAKAQMAGFFRDQVLNRARARRERDELSVVIVLSAPAFLDRQLRLEPVNLEPDPNRRIFYMRYRPLPPRPGFTPLNPDQAVMPPAAAMPPDDLENALRHLDARVLTSSSPEEFRKALSSMLADIQRM